VRRIRFHDLRHTCATLPLERNHHILGVEPRGFEPLTSWPIHASGIFPSGVPTLSRSIVVGSPISLP
jgi:hypothetical protein